MGVSDQLSEHFLSPRFGPTSCLFRSRISGRGRRCRVDSGWIGRCGGAGHVSADHVVCKGDDGGGRQRCDFGRPPGKGGHPNDRRKGTRAGRVSQIQGSDCSWLNRTKASQSHPALTVECSAMTRAGRLYFRVVSRTIRKIFTTQQFRARCGSAMFSATHRLPLKRARARADNARGWVSPLAVSAANRASVQELDRSSLRPFLTMTDLHPYTLTFGQLIQLAAAERRRMDENILSAAILRYETKSLLDVVPFN
jgi:hypothetical protein